MADDPRERKFLKKGNFIDMFITATAAAMGFTSDYEHVANINLVSIAPAGMNVVNDGRQAAGLFKKGGRTVANPVWIRHRLIAEDVDSDSESPVTIEYLKSRKAKSIASTLIGIGGIVSSTHTAGVNAPAAAKDLNASASTSLHIAKLGGIGRQKNVEADLASYIDGIVRMKYSKLGIRGVKVLTSVVPLGHIASVAAQAASAVGHAVSAVSAVNALAERGSKIKMEHVCNAIAMDLHYKAWMENNRKVPPRGGGPATDVVRELFRRRFATRIFGSYNVDELIQEPAGWMAIADKIAST